MSLSYYGFLRISELLNLTTNDLVIDTTNSRLIVNIRYSKTDQFGKGEKIYLYDNDLNYSPYKLYTLLQDSYDENQNIVDCSPTALRKHLKVILKRIGVETDQYSWHSFRRGGAYHAAIAGVQDSEIKKHGRWKSEAYVRYVAVDPERAGREISGKI